MRSPLLKDSFSEEEKQTVAEAIRQVEENTSGEIRVYIERSVGNMRVMNRAYRAFKKIGMDRTTQRNGVLFYVALEDRQCAILGDRGINDKVEEDFWESELAILKEHFKENRFSEGLKKAILLAGKELATYFPSQEEDVNELDDEIYFEED